MNAQETLLGVFNYKGVSRVSVACLDFEIDGFRFQDFASVKNQIIDSKSNVYGTELQNILETIEKQNIIDSGSLSEYFWYMFVIDAFIGNWDRHNGNWGFLYNQATDEIKFAPVFDCGSCLFPQIDECTIDKVLKNPQQFNARIYDFPTSAILENGRRINYYQFIQSHKYKACDDAVMKLKEKVNLCVINELIDDIPCISDKHKLFLKRILKGRFEIFFH